MAREKDWIGIADLMSVLMIVFLFVAVLFMLKVQNEQQQTKQQRDAMAAVAMAHNAQKNELHDQMQQAFGERLHDWGAEILPDGAMRFGGQDLLFAAGSAELSDDFKRALNDFFPQYLAMLSADDWRDEIGVVLIEGHTSSDWRGAAGGQEESRYLQNAKLSQARAYAVLEYVYRLPKTPAQRIWLRRVLRATGASYAAPVQDETTRAEDAARSRRVEFHAVARADEKLDEMMGMLASNSFQ